MCRGWRITDCRRRCLFGRDHITKDQEDGQELDGRTRCTNMQEGWIRTGKKSSGIETAGGVCRERQGIIEFCNRQMNE